MRVLPADISQYPFELPNFNPPAIISYGSADPALCDKLCAAAMAAQEGNSGVYADDTTESINDYHRSSTYCMLPNELFEEASVYLTSLVRSFVFHQLPAGVKDIKLWEPPQFLRYDERKNGHFLPHTDSAYWQGTKFMHTSPGRMITSLLYLNEGYEGGDLILNSVLDDDGKPVTITPKRGLVVIFPGDVRFTHEVKPVTKGVRFSVVGWYDFVR